MAEKPNTLDCCGFKYPIGAKLRHVAAPGPARPEENSPRSWTYKPPVALLVISRIAEECSGGVQLVYLCTAVTHDGNFTNHIKVHEHELVPYGQP